MLLNNKTVTWSACKVNNRWNDYEDTSLNKSNTLYNNISSSQKFRPKLTLNVMRCNFNQVYRSCVFNAATWNTNDNTLKKKNKLNKLYILTFSKWNNFSEILISYKVIYQGRILLWQEFRNHFLWKSRTVGGLLGKGICRHDDKWKGKSTCCLYVCDWNCCSRMPTINCGTS